MLAITDRPIDLARVLAAVEDRGAGAQVLFVGVVRDENAGRQVRYLEYEAYAPMAEATFAAIASEARQEAGAGAVHVAIVHRTGRLEIGEVSVAIAVSAPHRDAAYRASRLAVERLKRDAPIWKKEHFVGGAVWVEGPGAEAGAAPAAVPPRAPT